MFLLSQTLLVLAITVLLYAIGLSQGRRRGISHSEDVRQQNELRNQAVLAQLRTQDRGAATDRFLFDLSRELRRSMRGLWNLVSSLARSDCDAPTQARRGERLLAEMDLALGRAEEMALMDASMNGEGIEPISIHSLMDHVYATMSAPDAERASLAISFPSCRATVLASGIHLLRLLEILVEHARRAGGHDEVVLVTASLALEDDGNDRVLFRVAAPGTLLPEGDLDRLFDPTASRLLAGTSESSLGLNLSLAGALAAHLGTRLEATRRESGGALLTIALPCLFESADERRDASSAATWRLGDLDPPVHVGEPALAH